VSETDVARSSPRRRDADGRPVELEVAAEAAAARDDHVAVATQWQLIWWRFRRHVLAVAATVVVIAFYVVVVFAEFFAYSDPFASEAERSLLPPQPILLFDHGAFRPHVYALVGKRDAKTFKRVYTPDPNTSVPIVLFGHGFRYKLLGLIPTNVHLLAVDGRPAEQTLFLLGTDQSGRDLWSRLVYATRISLTIGLVSVALSLFLGVLLGGVSGFYGGTADMLIQRIIEVLRSIPTIPLWMGVAGMMPSAWDILKVYFTITIIISLIGWTDLARVVRGRFLSLREEEFIMAAELAGCSRLRIIFRHMVPSFLSHIIAATTLALPAMIISETSLSFLGLGLRPPAISWGVLLQDAQNVQAIAMTPWLLLPAVPVVLVILAFNFVGDGLRDAADPYQ
jgi:peptide/nickel transport system permease protein